MAQRTATVADHPDLVAIKPRERLVFHSDYWRVDDGVATVLDFVHRSGASDNFGAFWGVNRIAFDLEPGVRAILLDQVSRRGESWVDKSLKDAEKIGGLALREAQSAASTAGSRHVAERTRSDIEEIAAEVVDGAAYLEVASRMMVTAPDLGSLDLAVSKLKRLYIDRFGTLSVAAQHGRQRDELSALLAPNDAKPGRGQGFTSTELAGMYSLVTAGLCDPGGEYVGFMLGDVNVSAQLFDVDAFRTRAVVATGLVPAGPGGRLVPGSGLWGAKMSQAALLGGHRVVHVVLDGFPVEACGADLSSVTTRVDLNAGELNPLELFGSAEDEIGLFSVQLEKLGLMAEQLYELTDDERSVVRGQLRETLTQFYVDKDMWYRDARSHRSRLRLVGLDHRQVPRLQDLASYFDTNYTAMVNRTARDEEALHAASVLRSLFSDMLEVHGDLFNNWTTPRFDERDSSPRAVYDLSGLVRRGRGVQMAQLLNVVQTAVAGLGLGDLLAVHGCELVEERVKPYLARVTEALRARGGRTAWLYQDFAGALDDVDANRFESADYTVFGGMTATELDAYQRRIGSQMPPDLADQLTGEDNDMVYLRRSFANVVFRPDLRLEVR